MTQEGNIQGAPVPITLNGKEYRAYPLRDIDWEELNLWIRREYIKRVEELQNPEVMRFAIEETFSMTWTSSGGSAIFSTSRGLHKAACLMCRDQEIPYDDILSGKALDEITRAFFELIPKLPESKGSNTSGKDQAVPTSIEN